MTAPLLVLGWGNSSRGDDALGPLFVECLKRMSGADVAGRVEFLDDYQLQIEHALDLLGRSAVLFVDASVDCTIPFQVTRLRAAPDASFTSHSLSPQSVMEVYRNLTQTEPPPCTLLAIRGVCFGLGELPEPEVLLHLSQALVWGQRWLANFGESGCMKDELARRDA
ncbi:Ni/Fe hydrogenase [Serratia sp. S1B]|nr:Ni/Fe hydrogenase [Serratia sp. S1B]